jgi:hypothetical protein
MAKKKWCERCKFLTYGCQHLPDESDAARELEPRIIMLRDGAKREVQKRETFLAFEQAAIPGCATVVVEASPQICFRPKRLVVDPLIAPYFKLRDVRCGNMYQGAGIMRGVGCSIFAPHPDPDKFEPIDNLGTCDVCQPGVTIFLFITNVNPCHANFNALMYGEGIW